MIEMKKGIGMPTIQQLVRKPRKRVIKAKKKPFEI